MSVVVVKKEKKSLFLLNKGDWFSHDGILCVVIEPTTKETKEKTVKSLVIQDTNEPLYANMGLNYKKISPGSVCLWGYPTEVTHYENVQINIS